MSGIEREHPSQWAAITSIAKKTGWFGGDASKLRSAAERDERSRPDLTTEERERLKDLEREARELKRANEMHRTRCTRWSRRHDRPTRDLALRRG